MNGHPEFVILNVAKGFQAEIKMNNRYLTYVLSNFNNLRIELLY